MSGTVTMWAMGGGDFLKEQVKAFKALHPQVDVVVQSVPWGAAHDKFASALAAGTTPDMAQIGSTWMGEFARSAFDPVPPGVDMARFVPGSRKPYAINGVPHAIPWNLDVRFYFYRKDLAEQAGLKVPTNWPELKEMARGYQQKAGSRFGILLESSPEDLMPFAWSNGAAMATSDLTDWTLDTPQWIEALQFFQSFFTEGLADKEIPGTFNREAAFIAGDYPIFIGNTDAAKEIEKQGGPEFREKYGVFPIPRVKTGTALLGGSGLAVFKASKNRDAAWSFAEFLTQKDAQLRRYETDKQLPSTVEAWDQPAMSSSPVLVTARKQLDDVDSPPPVRTWQRVSAVFGYQVARVSSTGADPAEALAAIDAKAAVFGLGN